VIVAVPCALVLTRPVGETLATDVLDDDQFTDDVMFCVELSEYVPVAVSCALLPSAADGFAGVIAMLTSVTFVIVSDAPLLVTPP
jgi:hypothetical protein